MFLLRNIKKKIFFFLHRLLVLITAGLVQMETPLSESYVDPYPVYKFFIVKLCLLFTSAAYIG